MRSLSLLIAFFLLLFSATPATSAEQKGSPLAMDLSAHDVAITTSFVGSNLLLFGTTGGKGEVIVVVRGPQHDEIVRRKDKVAGIWVNKDSVTFKDVPSLYTVASSKPIEKILKKSDRSTYKIGFAHLPTETDGTETVGPDEIPAFRDALIRRKQAKDLYSEDPKAVTFIKSGLFRLNISLPSNITAGDYEVDTFLIRNGKVASAQTTTLPVQKVGFEAGVYNFAHQYSFFYGVLAVIIAIVAGWMANAAFRKG